MYVIQIKQRILRPDGTPRMAPIIMNYSLGDFTDLAFLYKHTPELIRFFTNCQILGIVPLDSLQPAEQEALKGHLKIAKERPEFPQYQILQYLKALEPKKTERQQNNNSVSTRERKQNKATKKDVEDAILFLIRKYSKSKSKDWEQETVNTGLFKKFGKEFNLSKKTRLGKVWAILYHKVKGIPPKGWKYDEITAAIDSIGRQNNLWDSLRK